MVKAASNTVKMDSRKFLSTLNDSAQSRVTFFEDRIAEMGKNAKRNWKLVALHSNELYFEDVDKKEYYIAEHSKDGRKVTISNIRQVEIFEEEKGSIFEDTCLKLINAIEENNSKEMAAAFNRMKSQRFSGRVVPFSGFVRCRDNVLRKIPISNGSSFSESIKARLVSTIVESLRDNVIVENGQVVSGSFNDGEPIKLPVTKWASRKLVARRMMEAAQNAYWSRGFQKRILGVASLVAENKIEEAVKILSPFLNEMEEFALLTSKQTKTLIENTLAASAIFNNQLCSDTATLFHRTNMRVSRRKIIDEWRNIARKAEHPTLAENVQILSESKNFEAAYDKFLGLIFEAISNREVAAEALATTLEVLRNKTPRIKESHELSSKLDGLIHRLKDTEFDDAAIYEAEDLIATIQEELAATETLGNFDQIPGGQDDGLADLTEPAAQSGNGQPTININSPLIQIGGSSGGPTADAEEPMDLGGEELDQEPMDNDETDELAQLLGGGAPAGANPGAGGGAIPGLGGGLGEGRKARRSLNESRPIHYEMKDDDDDDHADDDELDESTDPYAVSESYNSNFSLIRDYGAPVITDENQLRTVANIMHKLASEHKLTGRHLAENLESMAKAGIQAIGLKIPAGRLPKAIEEAIALFESDKPFPGAAAPFGSDDSEEDHFDDDYSDSDDSEKSWRKPWEKNKKSDEDDEGVAEDQFRGPRRPHRGFKKASINALSIEWKNSQEDAVLGEMAGVRFIFDHGGPNSDLQPVILSEDGAIELPIPEHLYNSAFAAAEMADDDAVPFTEWLAESLEQLRPISHDEDRALEEAMAKITTGPDGSLNVEVSDDVDVGGLEDGMDDDGMEMDDEGMEDGMGMDDEGMDDGMGMEPVDSMDVSGDESPEMDDMGDDEMPDYDSESSMDDSEPPMDSESPMDGGPDVSGEFPDGEFEEDEDRMPFEDNDITEPQSSKYTKLANGNKREVPTSKLPQKSDDKLDDIGPDLKKDDGSGTKPPTAKPMSNK